jgi:hypothetical protein
MRTLLPLGALLALGAAGCSGSPHTVTGPDEIKPVFACAGESGNCGQVGGGGQQNNNKNNPPATAP